MSNTSNANIATEYRNLPLALLRESATNPRRIFEETALKELAESIRSQGVLSPLLVRPLNEHSFEIVAGARRYRAAQLAEVETIPVRIVNLTDAAALEAQLIENLQRRDVHPLEEAQGFRALLTIEEPKYSIEQIAAKTGKSPSYVAQRLRLTELAPAVVEAFSKDEIGIGHALLLAKLQPEQQNEALAACYQEQYTGANKSKRILLPVRYLEQWIEQNVMLILKLAPFDTKDAELLPTVGSCLDCPKRTGHNKLLFADVRLDACTDPACYQMKIDAHVAKTVAAKPKLVQITTAYGKPPEGSAALTRNKYVEIKEQKTAAKGQRDWPEYKTCKSMSEAIITDGIDKGEFRRICADPNCPVHHAKRQKPVSDAEERAEKARREKERTEQALANATGLRVLSAIVAAVPVRLMKHDLLFVVEHLAASLDERRMEVVARQHGIKKAKDSDSIAKLLNAYLRRAEEGELGRLLIEMVILNASQNSGTVLKEAAQHYKVDTDAIAATVKQEFAEKQKAQATKKIAAKDHPKPTKKTKAA